MQGKRTGYDKGEQVLPNVSLATQAVQQPAKVVKCSYRIEGLRYHDLPLQAQRKWTHSHLPSHGDARFLW